MTATVLRPRFDLCVLMALAAALGGCPSNKDIPDDETTTASTSSTGEPTGGVTTGEPPAQSCPEHASADACCCFEPVLAGEEGVPVSVNNVCTSVALCELVELECVNGCIAKNEAALDCSLAALAAGTMVGMLAVRTGIEMGRETLELHLQGDGTAYVISRAEQDNGYFEDTGRYMLQAAADFMACSAGDVEARAQCLRDAVVGAPSEVCVANFTYEI